MRMRDAILDMRLDLGVQLGLVDTGRMLALGDRGGHALEQLDVVLVAIRLEIEVVGNLGQPLVAHLLHIFLHEAIVIAPGDSGGPHRGLFGPRRDLMGVQVMQVQLIDQRLLDLFMEQQKAIGIDLAALVFHLARQMTIDVDRLAVLGIAGHIRNVVLAIELLDPARHGIERAIHHQARDIPVRHAEPLMRRGRMAIIGHELLPSLIG